MKLINLGVAALLAVGSVGLAHATPVDLISNGDFSQTTTNATSPTQFSSTATTTDGCHWGGEFVSGWTGNSGYEIWYPSATAASTVSACTQWGNASTQRLPAAVTAPPVGTGSFVGLDGDSAFNAAISQTINGLVAGQKYTVNFWWASTQEMSKTGPTTEKINVSLGTQSFTTSINSIGTQGWSGWAPVSFTFTADSASELLTFLSQGTPSGGPPFALLANVSMFQVVPEPPVLGMFGGGLLGLGLLAVAARRRRQRLAADLTA